MPPLATACAFGLGIWLDSWKLGPPGVFFMVVLCGIGSPIVGMGTAGIIARRLAQGSEVKEWLVWMFEQPLVVILWLAMWQWIISLQPVPFGPGHTVLTVWLAK